MSSRLGIITLAVALAGSAIGVALVQSDAEVERLVEALDVDPGEVFADVGAGDGRFSFELGKIVGEDGLVYATEVDPSDLEEIRDRIRDDNVDNVTVVEGTQADTGLPEDCCDGILLRRVYHHFQDPNAMQASLRRALKDDGLLLIIEFDTKRYWGRPEGIPRSRDGHGIPRELVVSEMEAAGFVLIEEMDWRGRDYALLFREST